MEKGSGTGKRRLNRYLYIVFGVLFFGLGAAGTVLPLIPTTPFILFSAVCFSKSSERLHAWCISTKFYQNTVDGFVKNRTMPIKAKVTLLVTVTVVMGLSFVVLTIFNTPVTARVILAIVWVCHVVYFGVIVKTAKE